jgi:signal transduction histidine kinase
MRTQQAGRETTLHERVSAALHSLRTRLFLSFAFLVLLALVLAAGVFVALRREASGRETLDRVAATAPGVSFELRSLYDRGATSDQVSQYLRQAARADGVRILLVDQRDGTVTADSGASLVGQHLSLPAFGPPDSTGGSRFQSWRGTTPQTRRLTFFVNVYAPAGRPFTLGRSANDPGANLITIVGVSGETLANAWLGLLPGLLWAGLAALALSALMAVLLARSIARPILALTRASEEVAHGNFDQDVPASGSDEIGRLATAFNMMAHEVGRSYLQTHALIANASHDLKTPLTSILGFAQALRDGAAESPQEVAEVSGIIHEEAERILAMVDDLLYLSRIDAGEVALQRAPVNLQDVANRSLRRLESVEHQPGVTVDFAPGVEVWAMGDVGKIERIVDNLLDNARKYTPEGGRITLHIGRVDGELPQASLTVFNSGSFIPADELDRVFDRFYRSDPARTPATGGTGLGLAIVKDLVRLQHGSIQARSGLGVGTTFEVRLPLAGPTSAPAADTAPESPARAHRAAPEPGTIG